MTKRIITGYNTAYKTKFFTECEIVSRPYKVGDTFNGEEVLKVEVFEQPKTDEPTYNCQVITTGNNTEIVVINPLD